MKPIKIFPEGTYIKGIDFEHEIQYNLFVDIIPQNYGINEVNILCLFEPDIITKIIHKLPNCYHIFDCILTMDKDTVEKYPNAKLFTFNSIWADDKIYEPKDFTISTLVGAKNWTKYQVMRQQLWYQQDSIPNRKFFLSSHGGPDNLFNNPIIGNTKDELFYSQFHIAIENDFKDNWFSEKIMDCFMSKTVPIYCGCPNIGEFFNEKGVLKFSNINECISVCNSLTETTYNEMLPHVEENYLKVQEYVDWQKRVKDAILTVEKNRSFQ